MELDEDQFLDSVEDFLESLIGADEVYINQLDESFVVSQKDKQLVLIELKDDDLIIFDGEIMKIDKGFIEQVKASLIYEDKEVMKC